ncbi:MAG: sugar ABC transporter ATP-binding protein [Clostridiales Family XIII bacterium]|nr:sugar ABC transporter ATP-binding protein [Clostridiales Family XIII bacterium]
MGTNYSVEMTNIYKSFGGVHALKDVSIRFRPGEIHSIVGENGAGKSTLIKILSGAYMRDSGEILIHGKPVMPRNTYDMKRMGIGVIYQEFSLALDCTVAENIFISKLSEKKHGLINWKKLNQKAAELTRDLGFEINPTEIAGNLGVAFQQIIEITKALSEDIDILILDEPTAVLSPLETEKLFSILDRLKEKGVTIIYISHRLEDVLRLSDEITVLRDGEVRRTFARGEADGDGLVSEMIGRNVDTYYPQRAKTEIGEEVLRVEHLNRGNVVRDVSFQVFKGEVLGIAGLLGSGKTETVRLIFGADKPDSGDIYLHGEKTKITSPYDAMKKGINYLSENRKEEGVILQMPIQENVTLSDMRAICKNAIFLDKKKESDSVENSVESFQVKCDGIHSLVASLSGGNQQKVSIAKSLFVNTDIAILDEPTRGVDVGAKVEIYNIINQLVSEGLSVIMVSSEIEEIIGMCDRVLVIGKGQVVGTLMKGEVDQENIVALSSGIKS